MAGIITPHSLEIHSTNWAI